MLKHISVRHDMFYLVTTVDSACQNMWGIPRCSVQYTFQSIEMNLMRERSHTKHGTTF